MDEQISRTCVQKLKHLIFLLQKGDMTEARKVYNRLTKHHPPVMNGILAPDIVLFIWIMNDYFSGYPSSTLPEMVNNFALLEKKWPPSQKEE